MDVTRVPRRKASSRNIHTRKGNSAACSILWGLRVVYVCWSLTFGRTFGRNLACGWLPLGATYVVPHLLAFPAPAATRVIVPLASLPKLCGTRKLQGVVAEGGSIRPRPQAACVGGPLFY